MDFTPDVEDEVIRDSISHKLDITLVSTSNKVWRSWLEQFLWVFQDSGINLNRFHI